MGFTPDSDFKRQFDEQIYRETSDYVEVYVTDENMNIAGWVWYAKPNKVQGIVAEFTSYLFDQKAYLKGLKKGHKDYNPTKLNVVKIGINSIYGALGQRGSCINNIHAAITVTSSIRLVLAST